MTDDQGYGISSTFGGVIPTPALDRVAKAGLRYTQFHSTALCSPTRAALITGRNHHAVGFGVITEQSTGYPGYDSVIGRESASIGQKPIEGVSMLYTFDKANANAPSKRRTQYFEMMGNRAIYHDGWIATTTPPQGPWLMGVGTLPNVVNGYKWELYNIAEDYLEDNDLATTMPDKLREMQELFLVEASKYDVFPLDNDVLQRVLTARPSPVAGKTIFTYSGEVSGMPAGSVPNLLGKSYSISAEVEIPQGGAEGMLNTLGGAFGGYGLYLVKGKPVFTYVQLTTERFRWEGPAALTPSKHSIVFDFKYDGPGFGKGGTGSLTVDGKEVANQKIPHTIPFLVSFDESFDVGVDTRYGVDDNDYQVPFRFTGKLTKLTIKLE
jgi:arylsulfatase